MPKKKKMSYEEYKKKHPIKDVKERMAKLRRLKKLKAKVAKSRKKVFAAENKRKRKKVKA